MGLLARGSKKLKFILSVRHKWARVMSFEDYSQREVSGFHYHKIESNRRTRVCPVQYLGEKEVEPFETHLPDTYWAELTDASIIGASSVVISKDGIMLYDMLAHRHQYKANMTDNGLCLIGGSPKHIGDYYIYNYLPNGTLEIPTAISLACNMSNNYYHFMLQVASRFYLLSKVEINQTVPLVLDEQVMKIPQMKEVVEALNIDNRKIILIKKNQLLKVNTLYVISEPNVIVPNSFARGERRTENFAFDKNALDYLKYTLMKRIPSCDDIYPKRAFLSRKGCSKRRCNEEELEPVLSKFGFESLQTGNLTIAQQIALFSNVEHVIGGSGAAFTNLLFCNEGAKATLFMSGPYNVTCFSSLAIVNHVKTYFAYDSNSNEEIHQKLFRISPETIYTHLKSIYGDEHSNA